MSGVRLRWVSKEVRVVERTTHTNTEEWLNPATSINSKPIQSVSWYSLPFKHYHFTCKLILPEYKSWQNIGFAAWVLSRNSCHSSRSGLLHASPVVTDQANNVCGGSSSAYSASVRPLIVWHTPRLFTCSLHNLILPPNEPDSLPMPHLKAGSQYTLERALRPEVHTK